MTLPKHRRKRKHSLEYLIINLFVFAGIGILSLVVFNVAIFNVFTKAFTDFTFTDIYYTHTLNTDSIYNGPVVLVNVENKSRGELALLLNKLQEGKPKVIGFDVMFPERNENDLSGDSALKASLTAYNNIVLPYAAASEKVGHDQRSSEYFGVPSYSYLNMIGVDSEYSTIRYYYPYQNNVPAFTSALLEKYDPGITEKLKKKDGKKTEIRYFGNIQQFQNYTSDEVLSDPRFNPGNLKGKIILLGYWDVSEHKKSLEDRFFTPLNPRLSGRSHPDMYGVVIHANILRMALEDKFIYALPNWMNWLLAFGLSWLILPLFIRWWVHKAVWFHLYTMLLQLVISLLFVCFAILLYAKASIKIESSAILVAVLLLNDFILLYDTLVQFFKRKLNWNFHSKFFEGEH
jgi:CHASE2 domain-containing sensor protein